MELTPALQNAIIAWLEQSAKAQEEAAKTLGRMNRVLTKLDPFIEKHGEKLVSLLDKQFIRDMKGLQREEMLEHRSDEIAKMADKLKTWSGLPKHVRDQNPCPITADEKKIIMFVSGGEESNLEMVRDKVNEALWIIRENNL